VKASELFPILQAADPDRLARFYEDGLGARESYRWPPAGEGSTEYVYLTLEPLGLGIAVRETAATPPSTGDIALWTYVDDVDAAVERLAGLGATVQAPPEDKPFGERMATVIDPEGHVLHLGARGGS
jgi:lactoylglutathione lyase